MTVKGTRTNYPRKHERPPTPQDSMLRDMLMAKTATEKRNVLAKFNCLLYVFDRG